MVDTLPPRLGIRGSVKGSVLSSRIALVRASGGEGAVGRVLARLPEEARQLFQRGIQPMTWYPFESAERLDIAIAADLGGGDAVFRALGARSAVDNLAASHKSYVTSRDPQGLLKQTAQIYALYYNTGYRTYEWVSRNKAILRTFEAKSFSKNDCLTVVGWHEKAIELCGGKSPRVVETNCRARGDERCEYVCEWQ